MNLDSAGAVHGAFGRQVRIVGKLWRFERAEVNRFAVRANGGNPSVAFLPDAEESGSVVGLRLALVLHILALRYIAQIAKAIIGRVAVDVVDGVLWPVAGHVHPRSSVGEVDFAVNANLNPPALVLVSDDVANKANLPYPLGSGENASFRIVMDKLAKSICCNIGLGHSVAPYKQWCGQRPDSVASAVRLRHFSMGVA